MMRWITPVAIAAVSVAVYLGYTSAYNSGKADGKAEQAEANRAAYAEIMERINDETLNADDPDAVLCELHRLAGTRPEGIECSGL